MKPIKRLWWGLAVLILLSPLGLILPEIFRSGPAWGEWGLEEIEKLLGFVPDGLRKLTDFWSAPAPDYHWEGLKGQGLARSSLGYVLSGFLGVGAIVFVSYFVGRMLTRKRKFTAPEDTGRAGIAQGREQDRKS